MCWRAGAFLEKKQRSWDQQRGWGISIRARHLLQPPGQLIWASFAIMWFAVGSQRERNPTYALCALRSVLRRKKKQQGGWGKPLCWVSFQTGLFFGRLWVFLPFVLFHWLVSSFIFPVFTVGLRRWFTDVRWKASPWKLKGSLLNPAHKQPSFVTRVSLLLTQADGREISLDLAALVSLFPGIFKTASRYLRKPPHRIFTITSRLSWQASPQQVFPHPLFSPTFC